MQWVQKSKKDVWQTPPEVYEPIADAHGGIDTDPCAGRGTEIAERNIRPPENGLAQPWVGVVFMNPPFSNKTEWLEKAVEESQRQAVDVVYVLTPDSTDVASWWHEYIAAHAPVTWFATSRVNFIDPETGEQASGVSFNTAISVFGEAPQQLLRHWDEEGDLVYRPQNAGWSV
mgnify:CR=1 FL=1